MSNLSSKDILQMLNSDNSDIEFDSDHSDDVGEVDVQLWDNNYDSDVDPEFVQSSGDDDDSVNNDVSNVNNNENNVNNDANDVNNDEHNLLNNVNNEPLLWSSPDGMNNNIIFNEEGVEVGVNSDFVECMTDKSAHDFYELFLDVEILTLLVTETNRYAEQKLLSVNIKPNARILKWYPTDLTEMKNFLGILLYMGVVNMPKISDYWKSSTIMTSHMGKVMSLNRFQLLLSMFHFNNNEETPQGDRLFKIQNLIDLLTMKYQMCVFPAKEVCIDESMIPFLGRLSFKQYNKQKRHRYGIKIFKLCSEPCYTLKFKVYSGKEKQLNNEGESMSVSKKIVLDLMNGYLDFGRTVVVDNWYSSVDLAQTLLSRNTNMIGSLRSNRKLNPKIVTQSKLRKGEWIARRSNTNVLVMKWKDKREILMISTCSTCNFVEIAKNNRITQKPEIVMEYNKVKGYIDLSDQMSSYSSPLRKTVKWYRKIGIEILLNTSVINALVIFKKVTAANVSITAFREYLVQYLTYKEIIAKPRRIKHVLVSSASRKRCTKCYLELSASKGRKFAQNHCKRVKTECNVCSKNYCNDCFFKEH